MSNIASIVRTYAKINQLNRVVVDAAGDSPAVHIIFDNGEEELHIVDNIVISPLSRTIINSISEFFKRATENVFYQIPTRPSELYPNNRIIIDDSTYCYATGENAGQIVDRDIASHVDINGNIILHQGYSTLYEYYKQNLYSNLVFKPLQDTMYAKNSTRV